MHGRKSCSVRTRKDPWTGPDAEHENFKINGSVMCPWLFLQFYSREMRYGPFFNHIHGSSRKKITVLIMRVATCSEFLFPMTIHAFNRTCNKIRADRLSHELDCRYCIWIFLLWTDKNRLKHKNVYLPQRTHNPENYDYVIKNPKII